VVGHTLHLEHQHLTLYTGNYSAFERQRAERLAQQQAAYVRQQREIAHMHSFVERFRAKATKARQAQSRLKALERMELIAPAHIDSPFRFGFEPAENLPRPLLRLDDAVAGYGANGRFSMGSDSASIRVIASACSDATAPANRRSSSCWPAPCRSSPDAASAPRSCASAISPSISSTNCVPTTARSLHLRRLDPQATEQTLRSYLGGFGFAGDRALEPVAPLSGGEKARLVLALIIRQRPNLLLLDEPTNHLDLDMRQALAEALQEFDGALVLVSHDRHLLRVTSDDLWLVDGGAVRPFDGDLDDYPAWLAGRQFQDEQKGSINAQARANVAANASSSAARPPRHARHCNPCAPVRRAWNGDSAELSEPPRRTGTGTEPRPNSTSPLPRIVLNDAPPNNAGSRPIWTTR
jgi:ATP-binding cassette, subfamily F, member 3